MTDNNVEFVKPKRLAVLDFAKALAIIFMIFVHVLEFNMLGDALVINTDFEMFWLNLIEFTGGVPSACVFVFVMGFLVGNSKTMTKEKLVKKAGYLFLLSLFVNVFTQWVPRLFGENIIGDFIENVPSILATDIYAFDSLCMLCFAGIFCFSEKKRIIPAFIAVIAATILSATVGYAPQSTGNLWIDTILGMFVRINEWSYFPLFNWLPFPMVGFVFGYLYRTNRNYKKIAFAALILGVIGIFYGTYMMDKLGLINSVRFGIGYPFPEEYYYRMGLFNRIVAFGIIAAALTIYGIIVAAGKFKIPKIMTFMSVNIVDIYVIQWMLIGLLTYPLMKISNIFVSMLAAFLILVAALALTQLKLKIHSFKLLSKSRKNS